MLKEAGELAAQLKQVIAAIKAQRESNEVRNIPLMFMRICEFGLWHRSDVVLLLCEGGWGQKALIFSAVGSKHTMVF